MNEKILEAFDYLGTELVQAMTKFKENNLDKELEIAAAALGHLTACRYHFVNARRELLKDKAEVGQDFIIVPAN